MKCIMYISRAATTINKASVPSGLFDIYIKSKRLNAEQNITGVLFYRQNFYLQVIEGDDYLINVLYKKIKEDSRHIDIDTILEEPIERRYFPGCPMKLINSNRMVKEFLNFMDDFSHSFSHLNKQQSHPLNHFYRKGSYTIDTEGYENKILSLKSWPDFNLVEQTLQVMDLCARLVNGSCSYEELISTNEFGGEKNVNDLLDSFQQQNILELNSVNSSRIQSHKKRGKSNFFSSMKNFLRLN